MMAFLENVFIYLAALHLSCGAQVFDFPCGMQDLISCPRIEPGASVLGAQSLRHWPTREVPVIMTLPVIEHLLHLTLLTSPCFWNYSLEVPQGPRIS